MDENVYISILKQNVGSMLINEEKKWKNFHRCILKKRISQGGGEFSGNKKNSEMAKFYGICPSFSAKVGDTQFHKFPASPTTIRYLPISNSNSITKVWNRGGLVNVSH